MTGRRAKRTETAGGRWVWKRAGGPAGGRVAGALAAALARFRDGIPSQNLARAAAVLWNARENAAMASVALWTRLLEASAFPAVLERIDVVGIITPPQRGQRVTV